MHVHMTQCWHMHFWWWSYHINIIRFFISSLELLTQRYKIQQATHGSNDNKTYKWRTMEKALCWQTGGKWTAEPEYMYWGSRPGHWERRSFNRFSTHSVAGVLDPELDTVVFDHQGYQMKDNMKCMNYDPWFASEHWTFPILLCSIRHRVRKQQFLEHKNPIIPNWNTTKNTSDTVYCNAHYLPTIATSNQQFSIHSKSLVFEYSNQTSVFSTKILSNQTK